MNTNASFVNNLFFPSHYLFTRLRNDREGDFDIGIEEFKILLDAIYLRQEALTGERLENLFCLLFAKSREQTQRLRQHFRIVWQEYQDMQERFTKDDSSTTLDNTFNSPVNAPPSTGQNAEASGIQEKTTSLIRDAIKQEIKTTIAEIKLSLFVEEVKCVVSPKYTPATQRDMSYFSRRMLKGGASQRSLDQVDLDKTIQSIAKVGFFLSPVLKSKKNKKNIYLLVDNSCSMIPFEGLIQQYILTLKSYNQVKTLYFNNQPAQYLYYERLNINAIPMEDWLSALNPDSIIIMISDAGAARNSYSKTRVELIKHWAKVVMQRTGKLIWLNPMPAARWLDTTADAVRKDIKMFSFNRFNLDKAMRTISSPA